jgi:hypothetical protein
VVVGATRGAASVIDSGMHCAPSWLFRAILAIGVGGNE